MKPKNFTRLIYLIRLCAGPLLLITLVCNLTFATDIKGQTENVFDVKLELSVEGKEIRNIFREIESKTNFRFFFDEKTIRNKPRVTIREKTLGNALSSISAQARLDFRQVNDVITVKEHKKDKTPVEVLIYDKTLKGKVVDSDTGDPLAGATVLIKDASIGVVTDETGNFQISVPDQAETLVVSYIGYEAQEVEISHQIMINVLLKPSVALLGAIVVTGQGVGINENRISNKVEIIKWEDLENIPSQRVDQLLSAKLPNAQISLTGGQAGATSLIRVRGVNSAFLNSTPVFYIDGVRMDNLNTRSTLGGGAGTSAAISSIADIPMENIERIEYINGGAATTLYGSDAANGVIQIFTKKGGASGTKAAFEVQTGIVSPTTDFLYFNRSKDLLFQTGFYQKYHLGISGGKEGFGFSFSGNYFDNEGAQFADNNSNKKIDFSTGFRAKLGENLEYTSSFIFVNNKFNRNRNGNQGGYTGLWFSESGSSSLNGFNNKLDELTDAEFEKIKEYAHKAEELQDNGINVNRFITSQSFKYNPINNLDIKFTGGIDYRLQSEQNIVTNEYLSHTTKKEVTKEGLVSNTDRNYFGVTLEFTGQHKWYAGDFSFISTIGAQLFRNEDRQIQFIGTNIRDGARAISDAAIRTSNEFLIEVLNYGVYVQENIGFKDKIFLDLGVRGDKNPNFGNNIGTQYYPKVGLSYLASNEPFFERISWLNSLRIRGNYGVAGNLPPAFVNERTISFTGFRGEQAAFFANPGNDALKPEQTITLEGGIDLAMLHNRLSLSVSRYSARTKDALFPVPPTPSTGFNQNQLSNVGEIENNGWEISATAELIRTDKTSLRLNISANTLENKVVSSGGTAPFNINGFSARTIQTVVQQGFPVGYLRGNLGVFSEEGVFKSTTANSFLGTTLPDLYGNMGLTFDYANFSLFANASYQKGAYANSFDQQFRFLYAASDDIIPAAEIKANKRNNWLNFTNMFIEKTDFIKVRDIGINYTITTRPGSILNKIMIGANVVNPFNFTSSSFDPEATISGAARGQGGASTGGISYAVYSAPRQFLASVKINLK